MAALFSSNTRQWKRSSPATRSRRNSTIIPLLTTALAIGLILFSITGCSGDGEQTPAATDRRQTDLTERLDPIEETLANIQAEMES